MEDDEEEVKEEDVFRPSPLPDDAALDEDDEKEEIGSVYR